MSDNGKDHTHLLTTRQAAKLAGVHQRTIVSWIRSGKLPAMKLPGGRGPYLIEPQDLSSLLVHLSTPIPYTPGEAVGNP